MIGRPTSLEKRATRTAALASMRLQISAAGLISMLIARTGNLFAAARLPRPLPAPRVPQFSLRPAV
jgi:hypothetical protein